MLQGIDHLVTADLEIWMLLSILVDEELWIASQPQAVGLMSPQGWLNCGVVL